VLFSGNANNGANAGFSYSNTNNAPSNTNTNIGSQLSFYNETDKGPATWQKITKLKQVLVAAERLAKALF
jgi:hypothetical protein